MWCESSTTSDLPNYRVYTALSAVKEHVNMTKEIDASSHRQTTSSCFVYKLFSSSGVVQTNNMERTTTTLDQQSVVDDVAMLFVSGWLSWKHDALPILLLTNDRIVCCQICGAAFGQW